MPIVQTSLKSKNYNALGIDEIADDIENIITEVNILSAGGGSGTTVVVEIPQGVVGVSGILGMGTVPIELLPAPGVGMYYDIEKLVLEYTYVTTNYTLADAYLFFDNCNLTPVYSDLITGWNINATAIVTQGAKWSEATDFISYAASVGLQNLPVTLKTWNATDPTLGDGTLRAIITYTTRTFGA